MIRIFALTTRGLESLVAQEIEPLVERVAEVAYRRVEVAHSGDFAPLASVRTADDLFVAVDSWTDVGHTRAELEQIRARCAHLDLAPALAVCRTLRPITDPPTFSVTANYVGKRNYNVPEIKAVVGEAVASASGWHYVDDDAGSDLNLRLFIEHIRAYVGLRLYSTPLHRRAYKVAQIPGSLKPTVAAAMVMLAVGDHARPATGSGSDRGRSHSRRGLLLDPCCGAGTIIIEAARQGLSIRGGDHDPEALDAARVNWRALCEEASAVGDLPSDAPVEVWDAQALPMPAQSVDYVVSNLPWGRQVTVDSYLQSFYRRVCAEIQRVLVPGGRAVLLTSLPQLLRLPELDETSALEISLFGQNPQIVCYTS